MDEVDKMRSSQLANTASPEIQERFKRAKKLLLKLNAMSGYEEECRSVLEELIPGIPASATICPPFCCDHGDGIRLGEHVFINSNCTFLDGGYITFHIDRKVVVHTAVPFHIRQLGERKITFSTFLLHIYQPTFAQHINKSGLYMTLVTIFADDNPFVLHTPFSFH